MTQDRIESRRAFMKKFGKLAGAAAVVAVFMTTGSNNAEAKSGEDNPSTAYGNYGCPGSCWTNCDGECVNLCIETCWNNCKKACKLTCNETCGFNCGLVCSTSN